MRRGPTNLCRNGIQFGFFLSLGIAAANMVVAELPGDTRPGSEAPAVAPADETPMLDDSPQAASYGIRFRITGYLGRQYARDGQFVRSLQAYQSMLNVDDPSWPDNEQGDSMRIARDIEVTQMMTESGFYDEATRVLHTSLILARVNSDPQQSVVERQIATTAELARAKGVYLTALNLDFGLPCEMVAQAALDTGPNLDSVQEAFEKVPALVATEPAEVPMEPVISPKNPPRELPARVEEQREVADTSDHVGESRKVPAEKSRLSRLMPFRHHERQQAKHVVQVEEETPPKPMVSPDISPTYCPQCSVTNGRAHSHATVRQNAPTGGASTRVTHRSISSPPPSPVQPPRSAKPREIASAQVPQDAKPERKLPSPLARQEKETKEPRSPVDVPSASETADATSPEVAVTSVTSTADETAPSTTPPAETNIQAASSEEGPELSQSTPQSIPETPEPAPTKATTSTTRYRVGVAGQVANPGIFNVQGTSTTLAALLRRTGQESIEPDKHARILRSVDLRDGVSDSTVVKDFYCQRVGETTLEPNQLETPVYGQELVIVDGPGDKPIYVAVMPHFILQIPHDSEYPVTADQIIKRMSVHWTNIREQDIGIVRFEQWGRAAKVAPASEKTESLQSPLGQGDVLYIDGLYLDRSQVMAAAESVAKLAGTSVRKPHAADRAQTEDGSQ